jgi:hypoxanthine phosphoribosyltransferase
MILRSHDSVLLGGKAFRRFISEEEIQQRIRELADALNRDYEGRRPLLLVVLNGAFLFAADLVRHLSVHPEIQFIRISTYGDTMNSSETAQVLLGLECEVENREVLIVEDIVDTGFTTSFFVDLISRQRPASVRLATLLFKPEKHQGSVLPDYVGFEISPLFVVGYGMDYAQQGRELRHIYQLDEA